MTIEEYKKQKKWDLRPYRTFLLLLILLQSCIVWGALLLIRQNGTINIDLLGYAIYSTAISITAFSQGALWISSKKSWDIKSFTDRLENVDACDHVIFRAKRIREMIMEGQNEGKNQRQDNN